MKKTNALQKHRSPAYHCNIANIAKIISRWDTYSIVLSIPTIHRFVVFLESCVLWFESFALISNTARLSVLSASAVLFGEGSHMLLTTVRQVTRLAVALCASSTAELDRSAVLLRMDRDESWFWCARHIYMYMCMVVVYNQAWMYPLGRFNVHWRLCGSDSVSVRCSPQVRVEVSPVWFQYSIISNIFRSKSPAGGCQPLHFVGCISFTCDGNRRPG